tara:strand:- start:9 stop:332 length:324 start_codon:yes stop_codon:yes gene_type:complete
VKIIKKNFYILFIIFFSFCTSGPDYEDFELSAEKWNTCMFWLEEYFIDDFNYSDTSTNILLAGLNLSTGDTYEYTFETTDFSQFYNDLYNFEPKAKYVCDFWFDIMQ